MGSTGNPNPFPFSGYVVLLVDGQLQMGLVECVVGVWAECVLFRVTFRQFNYELGVGVIFTLLLIKCFTWLLYLSSSGLLYSASENVFILPAWFRKCFSWSLLFCCSLTYFCCYSGSDLFVLPRKVFDLQHFDPVSESVFSFESCVSSPCLTAHVLLLRFALPLQSIVEVSSPQEDLSQAEPSECSFAKPSDWSPLYVCLTCFLVDCCTYQIFLPRSRGGCGGRGLHVGRS